MKPARVAAVVAICALAGCGGQKHAGGALEWQGKPTVFYAQHLPNDRVVIARVKNSGSKTLRLVGMKLRVVDAAGRQLKATAGFSTTFAHGLYGALEQPVGGPPVQELYRLGKVVYLTPGSSTPFYAAWHLPRGAREPVRIDYGSGTLAVPKATSTAH